MKVSVLITMLLATHLVDAQQKYAPHVDQLNVRNLPTTINSVVTSTLTQGTTVDIQEQRKDDQGRIWYKTDQGWIASWLVSPVITISSRGIETNDKPSNIEDTSSEIDEPVWGDSASHDYENLSDTNIDSPIGDSEEDDFSTEMTDQYMHEDSTETNDTDDTYEEPSQSTMESSDDEPTEYDSESNGDNDNSYETADDF